MTGIIYVATNKQNGKRYVGQTINFTKRLNGHKRNKRNNYFDNALKKYGTEEFDFLKIRYDVEFLDFWESHWINHLNTLHPNGYNLMTGGAAPKHSEETKLKISEGKRGPLHQFFGKHFTEEHRANIGDAQRGKNKKRGRIVSAKTREKMSKAQKGKKHSEETKEKIRVWRQEHFMGEGNPFFGKTHSQESRKKIGAAFKGKPWTENRRKAYEQGVKQNGLKKKEVKE